MIYDEKSIYAKNETKKKHKKHRGEWGKGKNWNNVVRWKYLSIVSEKYNIFCQCVNIKILFCKIKKWRGMRNKKKNLIKYNFIHFYFVFTVHTIFFWIGWNRFNICNSQCKREISNTRKTNSHIFFSRNLLISTVCVCISLFVFVWSRLFFLSSRCVYIKLTKKAEGKSKSKTYYFIDKLT